LECELSIDGARLSPDTVELTRSPARAAQRSTGGSAKIRLPAAWVVNEFREFALEEDQAELSGENVAAWLGEHLRRHAEDIHVLMAMLRQAEKLPKQGGFFRHFRKSKPAAIPMWRWVATESVTLDGEVLAVDGTCERLSG